MQDLDGSLTGIIHFIPYQVSDMATSTAEAIQADGRPLMELITCSLITEAFHLCFSNVSA